LRVLRRKFGPEREKVTGGWRTLQNMEIYNLYTSPTIIRVMETRRTRWGRACSTHERDEKCIQHFCGET